MGDLMNTADLKQFIVDYTNDVWNKHDVAAMDRYYAASYVHHDVSRPDVNTLDDYKAWARDFQGGLPDLQIHFDDVIADPDGKVVKRWTATGVQTGTLAGIPATGKAVRFSGSSAYRLVEGKIVESWYVYDLLGLLQQLGVIPTPGKTAAA
jgi:steroid delta-isomerase-like uncharacterized protein